MRERLSKLGRLTRSREHKQVKEDMKEYKFLIVHAVIGLLLGTAILIVSSYLHVQPEMVFLYILVAESYIVLSIILRLAQSTHSLVNNQEDILSGQDGMFNSQHRIISGQDKILADTKELIRRASDRDVDYIKTNEKEIFDLVQENKKRTKNRFYGIWCVERFETERFTEYFEYEKEMHNRGVRIHRLINTETVSKPIIREHLKKFSDAISDGKYIVTSTTHRDYEMVVCFECKEGDNNTLALQLLPDRINRRVDLAIYSFYRTYMVTMTRLFESLEERGENLNDYWDSNKPDESINKWITASDEHAIKLNAPVMTL